jgi:carbon starvation protein
MLLESALAVGVVLAMASSLNFGDYKSLVWPTMAGVKANPVLAFSLGVGHLLNSSLHIPTAIGTIFGILMVEGFVVTTLDSAVRINRYLFEELWTIVLVSPPKLLRSYWFNSGLSAILMLVMAYYNAFLTSWLAFGSANQLLAALTLLSIAVWFMGRGKVAWAIIIPGIFMMVTTLAALVILPFQVYIKMRAYTLLVTDLVLLGLSIGVIIVAVRTFRTKWLEMKAAGRAEIPELVNK